MVFCIFTRLFKPLSGSQQLRLVLKNGCCRCSFQQEKSWLTLIQVVQKSFSSRGCTEGHPTIVLLFLRKSTTSSRGMWTILPYRQTNMRLGHVVQFSVISSSNSRTLSYFDQLHPVYSKNIGMLPRIKGSTFLSMENHSCVPSLKLT